MSPVESEGRELRRSIDLQARRTQVASLLEVFDAPSIVGACTRRASATIPLQSLSLLNSDFVVARAARLAERLDRECGPDASPDVRVARACLICLSRPPTADERAAALDFLMVLSELLPHTSAIADEITLVRSMTTESVDHEAALRLIHSGKVLAGRPTLGSWVVYALGSENRDLPAYVVLSDPGGLPVDGVRNWSSGWLPAVYQGTPFRSGANPVLNLETPRSLTPEARGGQLRFLEALNRSHLARHAGDTELEARIANFETAARMQTAVPAALDLESEPKAIRRMYGLDARMLSRGMNRRHERRESAWGVFMRRGLDFRMK